MKHLYKITILLLLALLMPATALAYDFEVDGIYYNINGSEATVSNPPDSNKYIGDIAIPSTVTYNSATYSVTSINGGAFWDCPNLTSITIPPSVTSIGDYAFYNCSGLTSISIPSSVTRIGEGTFYMCFGLTSITIPSSMRYISNRAFECCTSLASITIPESVTDINMYAFAGCSSLLSITIPNSVTYIGSWAFLGCSSLTSITIPSKLGVIGEGTFTNCSGLTSITIPSTVVSIEGYAFEGCSNLTSILIPSSVTSIGEAAFAYCKSLAAITIPSSVTSISHRAFQDCNNLSIMFITGEGEWQTGRLPETIKTLYIGSEVSGVKGMQVNPEKIYSYATTPPVCDENSFTGYDAELHVPASSMAAYFIAPYWCNFTNIFGDAVAVTDLSINRDSVEMLMGEQISLHATISPTVVVPNNVLWISSDNTVATVVNGVVTAVKGGECDIIATCQDKRSVCHVIVTEILPTEVTLNQDEAKIEIGNQLNLTATVLPENTSNKTITWESTNSAVATVNDGIVTGVGQGECNIVATCGDKQAICHVIVVEHLIYITLDQHETRLLPNHLITLTPTLTPVATDLVVTSSNPAVAAARLAGNKIQVMGITEGTATIYVNSADGYAFPDSCVVTVYTERGDVNCDGFVNISDATSLIDALLDGDNVYSTVNADCNNDGKVTITDLTRLIDALLGGTVLPEKERAMAPASLEEMPKPSIPISIKHWQAGCF